jgi:tRNA pseudouridine38-40 synthase
MARYQVILAYDGTDFSGFQRQAKGRSVQGTVEDALRRLGWPGRAILSAGRTDAGVHATGQVIAFDLEWTHTSPELMRAVNAQLPQDVAFLEISQAPGGFHPRYGAISRRYVYRIFQNAVRHPLHQRYAWRVWPPVDLERLEQAALPLLGRFDFAAFGNPPRPNGSTVRTVFSARWMPEGPFLAFEIVADAFLYHMVRRMVSLQVEIGQGREPIQVVQRYLEGQMPSPVQGLAPAQGLVLAEVRYPSSEASKLVEQEKDREDERAEDLHPKSK